MATNQDREIATSSSPFVSTTLGPTDTHLSAAGGPPASFANTADLAALQGGSSLTSIDDGRVLRADLDALGPSDPPHPSHQPGVTSRSYQGPARATSYSLDVVVEGGNVVRRDDLMAQNTGPGKVGNTQGKVKLKTEVIDPKVVLAELRKECGCLAGKYSHDDKSASSKFSEAHRKKHPHYKEYFDLMHERINGMARELGIDAQFILVLSSHEGSWFACHAICLNNPFGLTAGGHDNIQFDSLDEAAAYWVKKYGPHVKGAKTMQEFMNGLKEAGYNANPNYFEKFPDKNVKGDRFDADKGDCGDLKGGDPWWGCQERAVKKRMDTFGYEARPDPSGATIVVPKSAPPATPPAGPPAGGTSTG